MIADFGLQDDDCGLMSFLVPKFHLGTQSLFKFHFPFPFLVLASVPAHVKLYVASLAHIQNTAPGQERQGKREVQLQEQPRSQVQLGNERVKFHFPFPFLGLASVLVHMKLYVASLAPIPEHGSRSGMTRQTGSTTSRTAPFPSTTWEREGES